VQGEDEGALHGRVARVVELGGGYPDVVFTHGDRVRVHVAVEGAPAEDEAAEGADVPLHHVSRGGPGRLLGLEVPLDGVQPALFQDGVRHLPAGRAVVGLLEVDGAAERAAVRCVGGEVGVVGI